MKYRILLIALVLCIGCAPRFIPGSYNSKENHHYFDFKKDSSFVYEYGSFNLYRYSTGTWSRGSGNSITLNSSLKDSIVTLEIEELKSKNSVINVHLDIKDGLELSNYACALYVNGSLFDKKRCDSVLTFTINSVITSLFFSIEREPLSPISTAIAFPIITKDYKPVSRYSDINARISFSDSLFFFKVFNSEQLKIKKNKIEVFNSNRRKWEKVALVKDSITALNLRNAADRRR